MTDRELMQQALEALIWTTGSDDFGDGGKAREGALKLLYPSIAALRERLAQPEQEPVAWLSRDDARLALWEAINKREFGNPTDDKLILDHLHQQGLWIGKYTTPPRQWQGLTGEEVAELTLEHVGYPVRLTEAIEAKLKEKNT